MSPIKKSEDNKTEEETGAKDASEAPKVVITPAVEPAKEPTRIYLGPNLPGGRLMQSTVFRGGIPAYLADTLAAQPEINDLIVPVDEMSGVQARIVQKGTAEHAAYQTLLGKGN
ncbi:hypothetical protein SAMN04487895_12724 [Paenibacillus sophorae]|uniref:Uncharacterized protein n=1 Tax=Paenibacillus sophorae TaxID=1333845 RepID=A0A1H8VSJ9_9BACL|nr:hypothetical protein [Paenibacillus sophorae]QWU15679.1 hypothetical protein KP014_28335 [Paenibacillus sophorae]SEP18207.1 hypothetical protein SAMN04487895_12724 [Paenibacillus sophorae]